MNIEQESGTRPLDSGMPPPPEGVLRDIADEIEDHLACSAGRHASAGAGPGAARDQALRDFGDPKRIAAELALITQGDIRMNQKLLCALVAGLTLALAATAYFGYRSTALVGDQVRMMQEQMTALAAADKREAAPVPYGTIHITAKRGGKPLAGVVFTVSTLSPRNSDFYKEFVTDERGEVDTGWVPLQGYSLQLLRPASLQEIGEWTWRWEQEIRVNQPGETVECEYDVPTLSQFSLGVEQPYGCTLSADTFLGVELTLTNRNGFSCKALADIGDTLLIPSLPAGNGWITTRYFLPTNVESAVNLLGSGPMEIEFPPAGDNMLVRPILDKPLFYGRVFEGSPDMPVAGVLMYTNLGQSTLVAHTDATGYFGLPVRGASSKATLVYELERREFALAISTSSTEPVEIDLNKLARLYIRAESLPTQLGEDLLVDALVIGLTMARPPDSPDWLIGDNGMSSSDARLRAGSSGKFEPAGLLILADCQRLEVTLQVQFHLLTRSGRHDGALSLRLADPPLLVGGELTEMVITPLMFNQVLSSSREFRGDGTAQERLREWLAEQDDSE